MTATKTKLNTTEKQRLAIDFNEGDILVSASAGSGKTFVMVERVLRLILEGRANVDEILCVTFTVLAAGEMKAKIAKKITERLHEAAAEGDEDECARLAMQLELLPSANISTVHSFCKNLIKEFFYEAGVDPSFSMVSDAEREKLVKRAIDRYFEEMYDEEDEKLDVLLPVFFKYRSDLKLKELVVSVYEKMMAEADPFGVLNDGEFFYTPDGVRFIYDELAKSLRAEISALAKKIESYGAKLIGYPEFEGYLAQLINALNSVADEQTCAQMTAALREIDVRKPTKKRNADEKYYVAEASAKYIAELFRKFKERIFSEYELNGTEEDLAFSEDGLKLYRAFVGVVKGFADAYAAEKREENCLDFSDLEHFALKILKNDEIRKTVAARFKYVFTDEYQDTSGVQEFILSAVSGGNLFMVGDVKQNIYDFRGCNPAIFAEKRRLFETAGCGTVIDLDQNFRSTKAVIDAVNRTFSGSMTKECGNVDYAANQMIFGADYPEDFGTAEIHVVKKSENESSLPEGVYGVVKHLECMKGGGFFAEGAYIAELIEGLIGKQIPCGKNGEEKKIEFGDIAILLRNANSTGDSYARELVAAGIPVSASSKKSIGDYAEIAFLIDLIKLIVCFNQDIPLASVLKSSIGKVTDSELYAIRRYSPKGSFVDAYRAYLAERDDELALKLRAFDEYFEKIRLMAEFMPCDELLTDIIRENAIDVTLLASSLGEFKLARVNAFLRAAGAKRQTVSEFLSGIDKTVESLTIAYDDCNAVKIMSVHASKGLEYPIVILAGAMKNYNDKDKVGNFIFDRKYGVAIAHYDAEKMTVKKTAFLLFMKKKLTMRSREEEMRILYVALTRARNELYVVGEYSKQPELKPAHSDGDIYSVKCPFDFFADGDMPLIDRGELDCRREYEREPRKVLIGECDRALFKAIDDNISFVYASECEGLSVKRSVTSALKYEGSEEPVCEKTPLFFEPDEIERADDEEEKANEKANVNDGGGKTNAPIGSPSDGYMRSAADRGTAYHAFLEKCDFTKGADDEIAHICDGGLLPEESINLLSRSELRRILCLSVFSDLKDWALYCEQPFTAYMPSSLISGGTEKGEILVQGVIDLLCVKGDEVMIIDYKYSSEKDDGVLLNRYEKQLKLYAYAVEKVLCRKVVRAVILNLKTKREIEIEL